jgi:RNA polymerase sigma-70 factor (sigma-E family)
VSEEVAVQPHKGVSDVFSALYSAQFEHLVRVAALLVGSTPAAEDIVQDAFAKLHDRLGRIDVPEAWLRTTVTNACRNERRRLGTARRHAARLAVGPSVMDEPVHDLVASLRRLPYRQRAVVVLRFYVDLPEAEIADILGVRLGTVKSALHRALSRLHTEVEQ